MGSFLIALFLSFALASPFWGTSLIGIGAGAAIIVSFITLYQYHRNGQPLADIYTVRSPMLAIGAGLIISFAISSYIGVDPVTSFSELKEMLLIIGGAMILYGGMRASNLAFETIFSLTTVFASLGGLTVIYSTLSDQFTPEWTTYYSSCLAVLVPFAVYKVITASDKKKCMLWLFAFFCICSGVFAAGGRTGWVAVIIALIIMMILTALWFKPILKKPLLIGPVIIVYGLAAWAGTSAYHNEIGDDKFRSRITAVNMDRPASGRLVIWKDAVGKVDDYLWFGRGLKGTATTTLVSSKSGSGRVTSHAHNIVLQLLLDTGLIGFTLFTALIGWILWRFALAFKACDDHALRQVAATIFISFATYGLCALSLTSVFKTWWFLYMVIFVVFLKVAESKLRRQ